MQISAPRTVPSSTGLLLLDCGLTPIFVNQAAAQILSYPRSVESIKDCDSFLSRRIRSILTSQESSHEITFPSEFRSGRRLYVCRSFHGDFAIKPQGRPMVAILLERGPANTISLRQISERFHITIREQGVLELLLQGLTSKEIAARMGISPNTVKAFLRLIMIKMGVSTRSGIVGKALTTGH